MLLRKLIFLLLLSPIALFPQGTVRIERGTLAVRPTTCPTAHIYPALGDFYVATDQNPVQTFVCSKAGWISFGDSSNPVSSNAIQYASPTGNDLNSGLSWGLAKSDVYSAICNLPGGSCSTQTAGSGTVYVISGTSAAPRSSCGIWLMGLADPNYSRPPPCWLKISGSTGLDVIGIANATTGPNGHKPRAFIVGGSGADRNHPGLDLSATQSSLHFSNLAFGYPGRGIVIGECSNFATRTTTCQSTTITLDNVTAALNQSIGTNGPCTDITGASFWIYMYHYGCSGMGSRATGGYLANNAAAILLDGSTNYGTGLIFIDHSNLANGGVKVIPGANGTSVYVDDTLQEGAGGPCPATVWFTGFGTDSDARLSNLYTADCATEAIIRNDDTSGNGPTVFNSLGLPSGPATFVNPEIVPGSATLTSPLLNQQSGFLHGYVIAKTDVARRIGGVTPARYANLAYSNPSLWAAASGSSGVTVTTGKTDPMGGTQAAQIKVASGTQTISFNGGGLAYTGGKGGWIVGGVWVNTWHSITGLQIGFCPTAGGQTFSTSIYNQGELGNNATTWQFIWTAGKVSASTGPTCLNALTAAGDTPTFYGPVLFTIPKGALSDSEVIEFAAAMASQDANCPVGSVCNVTGHPIYTKDSVNAPSLTPSIIYSAAGTPLPTCDAKIKGQQAVVSDATSPTYMTAYRSGGAVTAAVICANNGSSYSWSTH